MKFYGCIQSFMLPWKLRKRHILPVNQNLSSMYFSLAKSQLVSCNLSLAMIWQIIYTHKLPKLCSACTLRHGSIFGLDPPNLFQPWGGGCDPLPPPPPHEDKGVFLLRPRILILQVAKNFRETFFRDVELIRVEVM